MRKVAIIGAGSVVFCKTLILDILATESISDTQFALMAPSTKRTSQVEKFVLETIQKNNLKAEVYKTTDRRDALRDADFLITTFEIGGVEAHTIDYQIPMDFGVDQCIGDTLGPGGIFRTLRTIPVMIDIAKDMKECCPNAILLNYVNPMATVCWSLGEMGVPFVGLCHGVQTTLDLISGYVDVPKNEIDFLCAGINHMAWFLKIKHGDQDLYPLLKANFEKPEYYINEKVRGEVLRQFGYFMTESTGHLSEYVPWFRKNKKALDLYCDEPGFGGETGASLKWSQRVVEKLAGKEMLEEAPSQLPKRSIEYGSYIIEAMVTGKIFKLNGNVKNDGMITNLPADCCVEGPIFVDRNGLNKTVVGDLPAQCAALNMTNINVQRLAYLAAKEGDTENIVHACSLDPLTSSVLTLNETREMVGKMLDLEKLWLPQFEGKLLKKTPFISIPKDVKRAHVPVDPALAIMARFSELSD